MLLKNIFKKQIDIILICYFEIIVRYVSLQIVFAMKYKQTKILWLN